MTGNATWQPQRAHKRTDASALDRRAISRQGTGVSLSTGAPDLLPVEPNTYQTLAQPVSIIAAGAARARGCKQPKAGVRLRAAGAAARPIVSCGVFKVATHDDVAVTMREEEFRSGLEAQASVSDQIR